jgi:hypothetical protein
MTLLLVATVALWSTRATSYPTYHPGANDGCFQCHPSFDNRGALHDMHVGNKQMTNNCVVCHKSTGDNPETGSSGADANYSCNGCHTGPGLRAHHANAGAPPDANGLLCATCHPGDPQPVSEAITPPFYLRGDVAVTNPCEPSPAANGEDYSGDGVGLDNDGDLLRDQSDTDCMGVAVGKSTWGAIKTLFK